MLTLAQIHAAQSNDLDAIAAVLSEMEGRIARLAAQSAGSLATNPARYTDYAEEFRQDAAVALFEYLPRWDGDSVDNFREYLYGAIAGELRAKLNQERNAGVDRDAFSTFKAMVAEADGDLFKAEKLAQTMPPKGKRLSADRAFAARLAWQGPVSIDKTSDDDDETSILHTLASIDETPEVRPKVGRGAALEALAVLHRYTTARDVLRALPEAAEDVEAIEDALIVPRDPAVRRWVLDAVAILRSYVSTTTESQIAADLRDVADDRRDERAAKIADVRLALDKIRPSRRVVLVHSFGIDGAEEFGWGDGCDREGLAQFLGFTLNTCKVNLSQARSEFAASYIAVVATTDAAKLAWETAAAECRKQAGRK